MIIFLIAISALIIGSFATCASYRLERGISIFVRSKCVKCNKILNAFNLIPLFSWLVQKGRCSNCKNKISLRYPLIELFFLVTFFVIYYINGQKINLHYALLCLIATDLIIIAIVDIEKYFIPNSLQIILIILILAILFVDGEKLNITSHFIAAFFYFIFAVMLYFLFYFISHIEALGIDDIKFLSIAGLLLGMNKFLIFILIVGILGIIFGAIWEKIKQDKTFPFAPALCSSLFISYIIGEKINIIDFIGSILFFGLLN